jgi:hypothetical protein
VSQEAAVDLGWNGETLPVGSHVCWYYSGEEQLKDTLRFLRIGLSRPGELCVLFADSGRLSLLLDWLGEGADVDVPALVDTGKVALIAGSPTREAMVKEIGDRLDGAMTQGYRLIRFLGFIGWGSPGWPGDRELLEFEAGVNEVVSAYPAVIVCTYGVPVLSGPSLIYGGLQTHPYALVGGRLVQNPYFLEPADFIRTLDRV